MDLSHSSSLTNMSFTANWKQQVTNLLYYNGSGSYVSLPITKNGCSLNDFLVDYSSNLIRAYIRMTGSPSNVYILTWSNNGSPSWTNAISGSWTIDGRSFNYYYPVSFWSSSSSYSTHVYITCSGTQNFYSEFSGYDVRNIKVTYNGNGGTVTSPDVTYYPGYNVGLPTNKATRTGYTFLGWSESDDGNVLTAYRMRASSKTLYAQWAKTSN